MTSSSQERAAGVAPILGPPPGTAVPRGRTGQVSSPSAPVPGGLTTHSSQSPRVPRSAPTGIPGPVTAARGLRGVSAAGRVRRAPAGGAPSANADGSSALSAGQMAIAAAMSEDRGPDSLDAHVRKLMDDLGLWGYHPLNSIGSRRGWPDWTIIGKRIIYRELKSERGTLRPDQALVRDKILAAGGDWALWYPTDLMDGTIARELAALAGLRGAG